MEAGATRNRYIEGKAVVLANILETILAVPANF